MRKFILVLILVMGFATVANATLWNRGIDSLGNKLIYDSGLNITWYDFTYDPGSLGWDGAMAWANTLSVVFKGVTYGGWRLPAGEMGHLYYTELGNVAGSLTNTSPFSNLLPVGYWTSVEYEGIPWAPHGYAYAFLFWDGNQMVAPKDGGYALAVRDGDVEATVPVPGTILMLVPCLVGLLGMRRRKGRRYKDSCS